MNKLSLEQFVSTAVRWLLALALVLIAWHYPEDQILYFFAIVAFLSGFFYPRRCANNCEKEK